MAVCHWLGQESVNVLVPCNCVVPNPDGRLGTCRKGRQRPHGATAVNGVGSPSERIWPEMHLEIVNKEKDAQHILSESYGVKSP
jgi:hypothetical protein